MSQTSSCNNQVKCPDLISIMNYQRIGGKTQANKYRDYLIDNIGL